MTNKNCIKCGTKLIVGENTTKNKYYEKHHYVCRSCSSKIALERWHKTKQKGVSLCKCGCGVTVILKGAKFLKGHNLRISEPRRKYNYGKNADLNLNPEVAYFMGWVASDGCVYRSQVRIKLQERDIPIVRDCICKIFEIKPRLNIGYEYSKSNTYNGYFMISNNSLVKILRKNYGIISPKTKVNIPKQIMGSKNKLIVGGFLRGLFDGDGSALYYPNKRTCSSVAYYFSTCVNLRTDTTNLLKMWGVDCSVFGEEIRIPARSHPPLYDLLYSKCGSLFLPRKKNNLEKIISASQKRYWSESQINILISNWKHMTDKELSKKIGRTRSSIDQMRNKLGFKKFKKWTMSELNFIQGKWKILTDVEISKNLGRTHYSVRCKRQELGLFKRKFKNA